jgi:hypothetical protein
METKPGYKTSEFWFNLIAVLVGALMASGAVGEGNVWVQVAGMIGAGLSQAGYSFGRGLAKQGIKPE